MSSGRISGTALRSPTLAVILPASGSYPGIRRTVAALASQTVAASLELVIVAPDPSALALVEDELGGLCGYRVVPHPRGGSIAEAYAAGIHATGAPLVALAEDHSFPEPEWAAALIEAHQGPWTAVGPAVRNANPATLVSWCDFLIGYGPWAHPQPGGEVAMLPGHNSSYKRERLLPFGDGLAARLAAESVLHAELRQHGERLYLEPRACTAHVNFALLSSWLPVQLLAGRVYAASRSSSWGLARRLAYAAGSPLIPAVRLARICRWATPLRRDRRPWWRLGPLLTAGLMVDAAGQLLGYLLGAGSAPLELAPFELDRLEHVTPQDRELLALARPRLPRS